MGWFSHEIEDEATDIAEHLSVHREKERSNELRRESTIALAVQKLMEKHPSLYKDEATRLVIEEYDRRRNSEKDPSW